jgi:hypothetical protein
MKPELTQLKQAARKIGVSFQKHRNSIDTYYEISEKLKDRNDEASRETLANIDETRNTILAEARRNPEELIVNLYEKQGEMRFDAANRLFLILVDSSNYDDSWKLRRNLDLLKPAINNYLDNFSDQSNLKIQFSYAGKEYTCLADCIFVVR